MSNEFIRIEKLNKYYNKGTKREVHVINDTTLTLPKTGLVCILGESGSGKTTLLHAVGALDTFRSGKVSVNEKSLKGRMSRTAERLRNEEYGYVFQNYYLLNDETVQENLRLALCLYKFTEEEMDSRIDYVLQAVDMLRYKKRRVSELSGGQKQRVAIARALVRTPNVIFADEPVGNLDEQNTMLVMGILKKLSETALVVLTTHEQRLAYFFADRIIRVCDGKIISDERNQASGGFELADDKNIYLGEYSRQEVVSEQLSAEVYGELSAPVTMRLVERAGKLYIELPEGVSAEIITKDSEVQLMEGLPAKLEMQQLEAKNYSLERVRPKKQGSLRLKQMLDMIASAFSGRKRKLLMPILCMLITGILTMVAISDYATLARTKPEEFVQTHSKLLHIDMDNATWMYTKEFKEKYTKMYDDLIANGPEGVPYMVFNADLSFSNKDFEQVAALSEMFQGFSYTPLSFLDEKTLIYGRMPELPNEVVVDKSVLEAFMERMNITSGSVTEVEYFLNKKLELEKKFYSLKIVGICESAERSVYVDATAGLGFAIGGTQVATLSSLKKAYPEQFSGVELENGQVLLNEGSQEIGAKAEEFKLINDRVYTILGSFPEEFPAMFVIADNEYENLLRYQILFAREFVFYTDDKDAVYDYFEKLNAEGGLDSLRITVTDDYGDRVTAFETERNEKLAGRSLVTAMILVLSLLMLYVSMKSMAMKNIENISVYRLMGIKSTSIICLYGWMILLLSLVSTVPGALLTGVLLHAISGIEALEFGFYVTVPIVSFTILAVVAANLLVGLLPIVKILRTPPAQLVSKSDL